MMSMRLISMNVKTGISIFILVLSVLFSCADNKTTRPNIILIMTDDQGWAQTGYYNHPVLATPNLDAMAANGLRMDRFYAAAPVCSPTRASVLTGRTNDRTGVYSHGYALRKQEKTIAEALAQAGYATGHFGKWHLNGLMGPGVPVFEDDKYNPEAFGFEEWLTVTNFFDIDPLMSHNGEFGQYHGTSSEIIVNEALSFIKQSNNDQKPFFAVIWDGSPHRPFKALEKDKDAFNDLNEKSRNHYGELVAFDRSIGKLREQLRKMGVAEKTLIWYCSDNGGLGDVSPSSVGDLRSFKGSLYEGGIRVPAIIEWPAQINPAVTTYPASTMDIFPTIADILDLPDSSMIKPVDGQSIKPLFTNNKQERTKPIPFRYRDGGALIDNNFKLFIENRKKDGFQLYHLADDPEETTDVSSQFPEKVEQMKKRFKAFDQSVEKSIQGMDYPEKTVTDTTRRRFWMTDPRYEPYLVEWEKRWEYEKRIKRGK
jgi:arylsulfatase A-like enzyme